MLHLLVNPKDAEKKPWDLFIYAFFITLICVGISFYLFNNYQGIGSVALLTLIFFPLLFKAFKLEEKRDKKISYEKDRFVAHKKIVYLFLFIFLGSLVGYFFSYTITPQATVENLFTDQLTTIEGASLITGKAVSTNFALEHILKSNFTLLLICLVLSLLFGLGALFLLTWNASVIGIAMAMFAQQNTATNFATATMMSALRYLIHGIPEMLSFFLASLGGSIICIALLQHDLKGQKGKRILQDGLTLVGAAIVLLFMSALIEVFVTPFFF